jgi:hypothetical protein
MAEREKQHYVPQFLLRNFASIPNTGTINLYNKKSDRTVSNAAIKNQAQEKYYYGEDPTFEIYLSAIEQRAAPIINGILSTGTLPDRKQKVYSYLLHFVTLFAFRTKANADNLQERLNEAFKVVAKFDKDFKDFDFERYRIAHPEPGAFNLAVYMDNWVITADLDPFLLVNETSDDFVISDNPLVIFNPMMQKRGEYSISTGLVNKGLLILFPLSPKYCLMLIDAWAYDVLCVGNRVMIENKNDIANINLLQSISGYQNLFFANESSKEKVREMGLESVKNKIDKSYNDVVDDPSKPGAKLLLHHYVLHKENPPLSFVREGKAALDYNCAAHPSHERYKEIIEWIKMKKTQLWDETFYAKPN